MGATSWLSPKTCKGGIWSPESWEAVEQRSLHDALELLPADLRFHLVDHVDRRHLTLRVELVQRHAAHTLPLHALHGRGPAHDTALHDGVAADAMMQHRC
eukprot:2955010-Pleurochrysis_carterae.AAC.5